MCRKILILFSLLLCFTFFLNLPVFAAEETETGSEDTYSFTGFDGNTYNLPALPSEVSSYKYYSIFKGSDGDDYYLFAFNDSLEIVRDDFYKVTVGCLEEPKPIRCVLRSGRSEWTSYKCPELTYSYSFSLSSETSAIITSDNLVSKKDEINGDEDFFLNTPIVETQGTLAPIMTEVPAEKTLEEIVGILPIVLMTIVGLIGLRKALAMLSRVLRQS